MAASRNGQSPGVFRANRRHFLLGGAIAGIGATTAVAADYALGSGRRPEQDPTPTPLNGSNTVPFYGEHQAGIATDAQAYATVLALDIRAGVDRDGLRRMMLILTDDAARLTQGQSALADAEPELAVAPARLTVTFGFGQRFVEIAQAEAPGWLRPLPSFGVDRLEPAFSDGDLLIQVAADDPLTIAHTARMLLKDARTFTTVRWTQNGFRRAHGSVKAGTTMRNLFGQVDGTSNPVPGTDGFDHVVWNTDGWLAGGTSVVVRRISMDLDKWDRLDRGGKEQSVGRYLSNGAPLTSSSVGEAAEFDEPDFAATSRAGFPVIPEFSHIARARSDHEDERIFRRAYNYDDRPADDAISNSGLLFISFQADVDAQFVPIQDRLDQLDLLNEWTIPIGSAVFAVPPGCLDGGYVGETILG
ncbi:peroxidase [Microbacterium sorbitolivorans]|uniref:Dyp-type peroxidase n=1 Tax=Microbacterium sorbitolivorans TaxID=1867410 RepID=A0A367XU33_9MICO|nr:Dyp-type peroxidase [Microbacterium sorbitolivorans]RCK57117.1 Dyp-type peroxidase [Microbacterium sorbitolivorans]GGF46540.1 peroxidase [Microbacterium sorbitolivorans]